MKNASSISKAVAAGVFGIGGALGWLAYRRIDSARSLPPALDASLETLELLSAGKMACYVSREGEGRPLVLLHGIHPAASAADVRPLFEHYRERRPVVAVDLPGFGASDRHDHLYSPSLYTFAVMSLLEKIASKDVPADVVALSSTCEFAARAARDRSDLFHSLTMISPTGFSTEPPTAQESRFLKAIFEVPVLEHRVFDLLATRTSVSHFLEKVFAGPVDPSLLAHAYRTMKQPGARNAVSFFLRGELFTPHVADMVYEKVTVPTLVLFDQDPYSDFARLDAFVARHPNWRAQRISPTRGMPHWEMAEETFAALDAFWLERAENAEARTASGASGNVASAEGREGAPTPGIE